MSFAVLFDHECFKKAVPLFREYGEFQNKNYDIKFES